MNRSRRIACWGLASIMGGLVWVGWAGPAAAVTVQQPGAVPDNVTQPPDVIQADTSAPPAHAPDQLIVQYEPGQGPASTNALQMKYGVTRARRVFSLLEELAKPLGKEVLTTSEFLDLMRQKYPQRAARGEVSVVTTVHAGGIGAIPDQHQTIAEGVNYNIPRLEDIYLLQLRQGSDVAQARRDYAAAVSAQQKPVVTFAEPNYLVQASNVGDINTQPIPGSSEPSHATLALGRPHQHAAWLRAVTGGAMRYHWVVGYFPNGLPHTPISVDTLPNVIGELQTRNELVAEQPWTDVTMGALEELPLTVTYTPAKPGAYLIALEAKEAATSSSSSSNLFYVAEHTAPGFAPDDPFYGTKGTWGQNDGGLYYPNLWGLRQIHADQAWDLLATAGIPAGQGVTIALLDTGVDCNHPDLAGACDTANAYTFLTGAPTCDAVGAPHYTGPGAADDNGHGTFNAGIIAARTDTNGILGVAYQSTILPIKVLCSDGKGSIADEVNGIMYAIQQGADVINMSFGGWGVDSPTEEQELQLANAAGLISVAAAGNGASASLDRPARYPETIAVGATNHNGTVANWSNHTDSVPASIQAHHLVAPGGESLSPNPFSPPDAFTASILSVRGSCANCANFGTFVAPPSGNGAYARDWGTSYATAYVSGVVGLLLAENPNLTVDEVEKILELTAQDTGAVGPDVNSGYGIVDASAALSAAMDLLPK